MIDTASATPCPASPDDPQDQPGRTMPARIAALLHTVRVMLGFGRHLASTVEHRSARPDFNAIAVCFGTSRLGAILAHLQRGLLRAAAPERVLLQRAARGLDLRFVAPRRRVIATPPAPADPAAVQPAEPPVERRADPPAEQSAEAAAARQPAPPSRPRDWNDTELFMPTPEEFEAQARRRPIGRTLVDICLDLAVVPGFCAGPFWNELFDHIRLLGGDIGRLMIEKMHREEAFCEEQDRKPGSNWDWQEITRKGIRRVLGFFIGEAVTESFDPIQEQYALAAAVSPVPS